MQELIEVSEFVKRQTRESQFSHFDGTWKDLIYLVLQNFHNRKPGYRDGVVLVPVPPDNFYSSIVQLQEGDLLEGTFTPRQKGETPRKHIGVVGGKKVPAKSVEIVCYSHEVLAENNEQSCDSLWEIISINASPLDNGAEVPMPIGTLIANYFHFNGGTEMKGVSVEQFVQKLKESAEFWNDKAFVAPNKSDGVFYVAIKTQEKNTILDAKELTEQDVVFFGQDKEFAEEWCEYMLDFFSQNWTMVICHRPGWNEK
jgi:hypothetical protein